MKFVIYILCFILFLISVFILSVISIRVEKFHISNINPQKKVKLDYRLYFEMLFLNKIKILSIKIDKDKIKKFKIKEKVENIDLDKAKQDMPSIKEAKELIKKLKIQIEKIYLNMEIGTEDVIITSSIVAIIASALGVILALFIKKYKKDRYEYKILPIYQNKNIINLNLNCIIKVKVVHIIFIIYLLLKKRRVNKNERTSNRGTYDYSYE